VTLDDPTSATPGFIVPEVTADEQAVFRVLVRDGELGAVATVTLTFTNSDVVEPPPPPPPPPPATEDPAGETPKEGGGCGCGTGSLDGGFLALGLGALLTRRRRAGAQR
jgi:MYXO-CTERM domain-containing protein